MTRRIVFRPFALEHFRRCGASQLEREILKHALQRLKHDPGMGYAVPFLTPTFYQMRVNTASDTIFWVHYVFDDEKILLLYLGVPGRC
jgi:hypothetical protein